MSSVFCFMMPDNPYDLDSLAGRRRFVANAEKIIAEDKFPSEAHKRQFVANYKAGKMSYESLSELYFTLENGGLGI